MLDLEALHAFYCVCRFGGVGAAARKLEVTQPAISHRLRALERQTGKKLYGRAANRLVLTEDGRKLLEVCEAGFEALDTAERVLGGKPGELHGNIRILALSEFTKVFLLSRIKAFKREHPNVKFQIEYKLSTEMMPPLLKHEADLIFDKDISMMPQVEARPIFAEEYVFIGPGPSRRFSWADLERVPWLSARVEDNYWFEFTRIAARHGVKIPTTSLDIGEIESLLLLAGEGLGYTLAPLHAVKLRKLRGLAIHRLPCANVKQTIYACRLKTVAPGKAAEAFWQTLPALSGHKGHK